LQVLEVRYDSTGEKDNRAITGDLVEGHARCGTLLIEADQRFPGHVTMALDSEHVLHAGPQGAATEEQLAYGAR
jgi:hypothetical protein